jgi:hypothetical protein
MPSALDCIISDTAPYVVGGEEPASQEIISSIANSLWLPPG